MWVYNRVLIPYVVVVIDVEPIRERFSTVAPFLDERGRRLVAAAEAFAAGYGGIAAVAMATGVAPSTIGRGLKELAQDEPSERIRRPGAGRKRTISKSLPSRKRGTRACSWISRRWSSRRHAVIRDRRCGGPARGCVDWRRHCRRTVSHLPPGTSKWNKIEHRLFSFISQNWRAKPLVSYWVIVELISAATTKTGLSVRCQLATGQYPSGVVVSDADMAAINIERAEFHGDWNYTISPNTYP